MTDMTEQTPDRQPASTPATAGQAALARAVVELEEHVAQRGWDAPVTVFALVRTAAALAQDPELAGGGLLDGLDPAASLVLDAMPARAAASTESIVRSAGLSPKETTSALGILELSGKVERTASGWRRRCSKRSGGRDQRASRG